ncbi:TetR/AcrR family transcriptional regulator [Mucilaginibacter ginkgonis]|uniref:TetR/AcrR family transcriptional regulator n=1 Tax=Mucilaginibacter ginkgonis TaxID=2682091 RepID=A0A6I4HXP9_9SPHI|nr:TetR/AcrR family transcriptional regulator [Mucilaginibacter ginkgonis]QQL49441.1 TetR/AcrR family transcriptional regulator [Mucilaginibacter ginkgonis]
MLKTEKEKTDKKDLILDAAERIISEVGYDGASTRMISAEAGVNMAMLNYYFGSKEGLFLAIFERRLKSHEAMWKEINGDGEKTPWQKMEKYIDTWVDRIFTNNCFQRLIYQEISMRRRGELTDQINTLLLRNVTSFQEMLNDGIKDGYFKPDVDVQFVMATIYGIKNYIMNTPYISSMMFGYDLQNQENLDQQFKPRIKQYLRKLLKPYLVKADDHSN